MFKKLMALVILYTICDVQAYTKDTVSKYHYLTVVSKNDDSKFVVLKDKRTIKVHKIVGGYSKGRLHYINDSTFQLYNRKRSTNDTIKISEIDAISSPSSLSKMIAYPCLIAGSGLGLLGTLLLIGNESNDTKSKTHGTLSVGLSAPLFILGSRLKRGRNYTTKSYYLRFIASKKKNLNRRKINRMGFTCGS